MNYIRAYKFKDGRIKTGRDIRALERLGMCDASIAERWMCLPQTIALMRIRLRCKRKYKATNKRCTGRPPGIFRLQESQLLCYRRDVDESKLTPFLRSVYHEIKQHRGW